MTSQNPYKERLEKEVENRKISGKIIKDRIQNKNIFVFMRDVDLLCGLPEFFRLLGYYAAYVGQAPTFRDNLLVPFSRVKFSRSLDTFLGHLTLDDGTDRLSRNVGP
jgi:hypothetical protein